MHGLIYRTLQVFIQDSYGAERWLEIASRASLETPEFEAMLMYDPDLVGLLLAASENVLSVPREMLLEDVGTYLVSHPNSEGLRRLLRFGGVDFTEFLHSLEDLPDRSRLAVADLSLPDLELQEHAGNRFLLRINGQIPGFGHVLTGVLRAIADDYGALVLLEHLGVTGATETLQISLVETCYAEGRDFSLGSRGHARHGVRQ